MLKKGQCNRSVLHEGEEPRSTAGHMAVVTYPGFTGCAELIEFYSKTMRKPSKCFTQENNMI